MIEVNDILNMTNEQAAAILESTRMFVAPARGNGKTIMSLCVNAALLKAIELLRSTPDKESEASTCD